ncbi:cell wall metabolism sensor histidine kinase WalK [Paenibacillus sp. N1-5-1-14]|uniref:HAMP domain-containing sensor histidine kinase n=1 Tax=Paenibacillus radicibacter TaxID=2972488 RepID=UPI002158B214|nr:HAMP domain-containing sensor histidine kinase [Paenibacillus radicibacter]MCR8642723.1 cell wall metabolism sensor histidine kinase WalK [Paenibacillus radicibacter]
MRNRSITYKLFMWTMGLFIFAFIGFFVGQTYFFKYYYVKNKVIQINHQMENFAQAYEGSQQDDDAVNLLIEKFYERNHTYISILDSQGNIKLGEDYYIEMEYKYALLNNGEVKVLPKDSTLRIPLNNYISLKEVNNRQLYRLIAGDYIVAAGILDQDSLYPYQILAHSILTQFDWMNSELMKLLQDEQFAANPKNTTSPIEGHIRSIHLPKNQEELPPLTSLEQIKSIRYFQAILVMGKYKATDQLNTLDYVENGVTNKLFVKPIVKNGETTGYIFGMTYLQPVTEAVGMMRKYYLFGCLIAVVFVILLSFHFSRMIAAPLIRMKRVTQQMVEFHFNEKLPVTSKDEIGSLSGSINQLSDNLKSHIDQLEVANSKLQQDIDKERKLEKVRKEFVAGVSHELKTPLSVMKSCISMLQEGVAKHKSDYYLGALAGEVTYMNRIVTDMLELAKFESGTYKLSMTNFAIRPLVMKTSEKFIFQLEDKQLHFHVEEVSPLVLGNSDRIEQVLVNLLSNAITYTPPGGTISVSFKQEGKRIRVEVENEGSPITDEDLERIWDRFYRIDAARNSGGTGLGLAIVKNILDLHHSTYGVRNTDHGVMVYFELDEGHEYL